MHSRIIHGWAAAVVLVMAVALAGMGTAGSKGDDTPAETPGLVAEGFGADSIGGQGGKVIWVTNLNDSGPGSFRAAVTAQRPRIVKFKVGGIIKLAEPIRVTQGRLTIDGASAADRGGITLFGRGISFSGLECRDVIVRHLRVRRSHPSGDCISIRGGAHRILIDHCSVSWADDENFGINKGHYVTVQWCIIAEGLIEGEHHKGAHSCGMLVAHGANHVSVHHNFFTGNVARNALLYGVGGIGSGGAMPGAYPGEKMAVFMPTAIFDFRNNLVYNFISGTSVEQGAHANVVGNHYRPRPGKHPSADHPPEMEGETPVYIGLRTFYPGSERPKVYCKGNVGPPRPEGKGDEWALVRIGDKWGSDPQYRSEEPFLVPPVNTQPADEIAELILKQAGAHPRDDVDLRLIEEYRTGTGKMGYGYRDWKERHGL